MTRGNIVSIANLVRTGAGLLLFIILLGAGITATQINEIRFGGPIQTENQAVSDMIADILPPPLYIIEPYLEATLLLQDPSQYDARAARLAALRKSFDERQAHWLESTYSPQVRDAITKDSHQAAVAFWTELDNNYLPAAQRGDVAAMQASYAQLTARYQAHRAKIDAAVALATDHQQSLGKRSQEQLSRAMIAMAAIGAATTALLMAFIWFMLRRVVRPLAQGAATMKAMAEGDTHIEIVGERRTDEIGDMARALVEFRKAEIEKRTLQAAEEGNREAQREVIIALSAALQNLASGNVTYQIDQELTGEYEVLRKDFNSAMTAMASALKTVATTSMEIKAGSRDIAQASADLSVRTKDQAKQLQEAATVIGGMTESVQKTAEQAQIVREAAALANRAAAQGDRIIGDAVSAMGEIEASASKIGDIVSLIDGIAFQTNLLALNAGVEAARAGDAGSGFAVVAHEVRALAQKASDAARDIRALIDESNRHVTTGAELVNQSGTHLSEINREVTRISAFIGDIAEAVAREAAELDTVNRNVAEMDRTTQQNATMVTQSSAAAQMLAHESEAMAKLVANFRIQMPSPEESTALVHQQRLAMRA
jgi:methyl-accepting chemotaxis protein